MRFSVFFRRQNLLLLFCFFLIAGCNTIKSQTNPGERYGHALVYDSVGKRLVLYGGFREDGTLLGDIWTFDGTDWRELKPNTRPPPRKWPAMAIDSQTGLLVMQGGRIETSQGETPSDETWVFEGGQWSRADTPGPPGLDHHSLVYHEANDRFILFGGWNGKTLSGETWVFKAGEWNKLLIEGPNPRGPMGFAYHPEEKTVFLFGGKDLENFFGDLWRLDEDTWQKLEEKGPSPRAFHGMAYDPSLEGFLVFSGRYENHLFTETWLLGKSGWQNLGDGGPRRRGVFSLSYFAPLDTTVFYGGGIQEEGKWHLENGLWGFKNGEWKRLD